ncbi:hypothetical protein AB0M80_29095 [Amycolatopsis sp. NPDC051045]|uniref:hypothetical protein n=1 Tax=Amycolatopsis sp. NPDC051045 TaxID=3156922 RepID=UPI003417935F
MTGQVRPVGGIDPAARVRVENAVGKLHKNAGVRVSGLREALGPELREFWGVRDTDPAQRVCAVVYLRLMEVLRSMAEPGSKLERLVHVAYNIEPVPLDKNMMKRLENLLGQSVRDSQRKLRPFLNELFVSLRTRRRPLAEHDIREAESRFAAGAARTVPAGPIESFHMDSAAVVRWFLDRFWCAPADAGHEPVIVDLGARGAWLCVFGDHGALDEYRGTAGCHWPLSRSGTGRELVRTAHRAAAGLLVNPSSSRGTGAERAFSLPPSLIAELVRGFPN